MWLLDLVAIICLLAGLSTIILGFVLGKSELALQKAIESTTKTLPKASKAAKSPPASAGGLGETAEQQALILPDVADTTRALAELAKALKGLSPAVQAFLVSIIFFLIAAALAGIAVLGA